MRAELDFAIETDALFSKPAARALLNLGLIAGNALPVGGKARLEMTRNDTHIYLTSASSGPRARLKAEAIEGLSGLALSDGLVRSNGFSRTGFIVSFMKRAAS